MLHGRLRLLKPVLLCLGIGGCGFHHVVPSGCDWQSPVEVAAPDDVAVPVGVTRFVIGGDARDDTCDVLPQALREAKRRGARVFIFLGDMEATPGLHARFKQVIEKELHDMTFYPVLGNHDVEQFGIIRMSGHPERRFQKLFFDTPETPVRSIFPDKVVYSINLDGNVHLVVLDNVSQKGFGEEQLTWLKSDLEDAGRNPKRKIVVAMHKALAENGCTTHAMDEDGCSARRESARVLDLLVEHHAELILAGHEHVYAKLTQRGIPTYITGGLGAPPDEWGEKFFPHMLQLDASESGLTVKVIELRGSCIKRAPLLALFKLERGGAACPE